MHTYQGRIKGGGGLTGLQPQGAPIFRGPKKIIHKIYLEQSKISYTLDRILYGYVTGQLTNTMTYTYIATCFHLLIHE